MADITQRSFTGGEVSPAVGARVDLTKYQYGLSLCENFFVRAQGGVYNRAGLLHVGGVLDNNSKVRLIPFSFNTDQTYVLVFENLKLRIVQDAGFVLDSSSNIIELDTPYTSDQLFRLDYTQTDDVLTIVHPSHQPRDLSRLAVDNFTLTIQDFVSNISSPTGLTARPTGEVGGGGDFDRTYVYTVTAVGLDGSESTRSGTRVERTRSLSQTYGVNLTWNAVNNVDYYRVYKDPSVNTGVFGWIGNSENTEFNDFNIAPITSDTPPLQRNPFSGTGNFPGAVTHYSQRRMYARTDNDRQTFFATQTGDLTSFRESIPSRSGDAITFRIFSNEANEVRYMVEAGSLVLFTAGAEFIIGDSETQPFTPETASVRKQSNNGCAFVKPIVINDVILYVQEKAGRVRDFNYDFGSDRFRGDDLSVFAEHLFEGRSIVDMAYTDEPYSILWCVLDNGEMRGLTYLREQDVLGWHRHTTKGEFLSVTSVSEGNENVLYCAVRRNVNGESKVYIERMESRGTTLDDAFYVDSGLKYKGNPISTLIGLDHLEGEHVVALADGNVVSNLTVENGSVSLPRAASNIVVGLPYLSTIETLDIDSVDQSLKAINTNVAKVFINFEKSRGGWVGPKNEVRGRDPELREIKPRFDSDNYNAIELKSTGEEVIIESQWGTGGGFRVEQRDPLPMGILAVTPDVGTG